MKKIIIVIVLASATTFGLFAFMAFLISSNEIIIADTMPIVPFDIAQVPEDSKVIEKSKPHFEPPVPPPVMPRNTITPVVTTVNTDFNYQHSGLIIDETGSELSPMKGLPDEDARPIVRVNPKYPMDAANKGIEGWVVLVFDISAIGEVINVKVLDSEPRRIFDQAAKQALKKWKYRAKSVDGEHVSQHNFTVQLDFTLSKNT